MQKSWRKILCNLLWGMVVFCLEIALLCCKEKCRKEELIDNIPKKGTDLRIYKRELKIYIDTSNENLRFNKKMQWNITYYVVVLFGVIIALFSLFEKELGYQDQTIEDIKIIASFISTIILMIGLYITIKVQLRIGLERLGVLKHDVIFALWVDDEKKHGDTWQEINKNRCFLYHDPLIVFTVLGVILIGYVCSIFIIWFI